jgi:hypothetical protein
MSPVVLALFVASQAIRPMSGGGAGTLSGTGTNKEITYWTGGATLGSEAGFEYDAATNTASIPIITMSGDLAVNGGDLTTTAATFNMLAANATTVNFAGAATTLNLAGGSASTGCTIDGSGNLACTGTVGAGGPGGSANEFQYNNGSGGFAGFTGLERTGAGLMRMRVDQNSLDQYSIINASTGTDASAVFAVANRSDGTGYSSLGAYSTGYTATAAYANYSVQEMGTAIDGHKVVVQKSTGTIDLWIGGTTSAAQVFSATLASVVGRAQTGGGTQAYWRMPTSIATTPDTIPTCAAGAFLYRDDSNDAFDGVICVGIANSAGTCSWVTAQDNTVACPF